MKLAAFEAWHIVALAPRPRKHRMPDLKAWMDRIDGRVMSNQELRSSLMGWHKSAGGNVRVVPKGSIVKPTQWLRSAA